MLIETTESCKCNIKDYINEKDNQQQTPLHKAAQGNHKEVQISQFLANITILHPYLYL